MSERFEVMDNVKWQGKGKSCSFIDNWTNKVYFAENKTECERIVVLLNSLSEENEQLKANVSSWKITCSQESNEKNVLFMKNRQLQEENKELKHWKKRMTEYLNDWFNKTEYLSVLYKINEIRIEIGFDSDE